jgi:hypothetical protein
MSDEAKNELVLGLTGGLMDWDDANTISDTVNGTLNKLTGSDMFPLIGEPPPPDYLEDEFANPIVLGLTGGVMDWDEANTISDTVNGTLNKLTGSDMFPLINLGRGGQARDSKEEEGEASYGCALDCYQTCQAKNKKLDEHAILSIGNFYNTMKAKGITITGCKAKSTVKSCKPRRKCPKKKECKKPKTKKRITKRKCSDCKRKSPGTGLTKKECDAYRSVVRRRGGFM